jgi:hypothetical protein
MVGLSERLRAKPLPDKSRAEKAYTSLVQDDNFRSAYLRSTADEEQVRKRIQLAVQAFRNI